MPYLANTNPFKTWVFLKMLLSLSKVAISQLQENSLPTLLYATVTTRNAASHFFTAVAISK